MSQRWIRGATRIGQSNCRSVICLPTPSLGAREGSENLVAPVQGTPTLGRLASDRSVVANESCSALAPSVFDLRTSVSPGGRPGRLRFSGGSFLLPRPRTL